MNDPMLTPAMAARVVNILISEGWDRASSDKDNLTALAALATGLHAVYDTRTHEVVEKGRLRELIAAKQYETDASRKIAELTADLTAARADLEAARRDGEPAFWEVEKWPPKTTSMQIIQSCSRVYTRDELARYEAAGAVMTPYYKGQPRVGYSAARDDSND